MRNEEAVVECGQVGAMPRPRNAEAVVECGQVGAMPRLRNEEAVVECGQIGPMPPWGQVGWISFWFLAK